MHFSPVLLWSMVNNGCGNRVDGNTRSVSFMHNMHVLLTYTHHLIFCCRFQAHPPCSCFAVDCSLCSHVLMKLTVHINKLFTYFIVRGSSFLFLKRESFGGFLSHPPYLSPSRFCCSSPHFHPLNSLSKTSYLDPQIMTVCLQIGEYLDD